MTSPLFQSVSAQVQGVGATFQVAVPSGTTVDDIIVVVAFVDSTGAVTAMPPGFAIAPNSPISPGNHSLYVMWKRATAPDVGTYDFTLNASVYRNVSAYRYSGCIPLGDPWDATASATDAANGTASPPVSLVTTVSDALVVWNATNWAGGSWTPPTGFAERRDSGDGVCTGADASQPMAGASGSVTGVCTGSNKRAAWLGALKPIPPVTSGAAPEGSLTVSRLVDEVIDALHGYTRDQVQVTELVNSMAEDDLTFKVAETQQVGRGLVELDEELIYVRSIDTGGNARVFTWGRGQQGTLASGHAVGSRVTMAPLYPRQRVRDAVFAVLRDIHPDVAPVGTQLLDVSPVRTNYPMPTNTYNILRVEWHPIGPSQMWLPVSRWRPNKTATTIELELLGPVWPGAGRARVLYLKELPTNFAADEDLSAIGYPQDIHNCVVLGATARMLALTEPARLQVQSVTSAAQSEFVPAGSTLNLAKFVFGLYQQQLDSLRRWYATRYPLSPKQTW